VARPEEVWVREVGRTKFEPTEFGAGSKTRSAEVTLLAHVHPSDIGKIIGRSGQSIAVIRSLFGMIGARDGTWINIRLDE